ncbi:MAG: hydrogenase maturation protease [Acidobacteriaceae bacterium]|nr:hydrogenase maturation protease [Acidobacteriaceae bacterium]MBV9500866.1 hydrogenase maturation protease [Acidobacteriaceae bacterium]
MAASILIAGLGNIFHGDDAFGVSVIHKLSVLPFPKAVRIMDVGIRSIDLAFALLEPNDLTILVDATARGGAPGTLYTIEIEPEDVPEISREALLSNSHGVDPVRALALAKSMGAQFRKTLLIGCEPLLLNHDESGHIGLSEVVEAAVNSAVTIIRQIVEEFIRGGPAFNLKKDEVCSHECT